MRRSTTLAALVGAVCLALPATAMAGDPGEQVSPGFSPTRVPGDQGAKSKGEVRGPNPYVSLLPDRSAADYSGWKQRLKKEAERRQQRLLHDRDADEQPILVDEDEPAGSRGSNDTAATAQKIPDFGTGRHDTNRARILGQLSPTQVDPEAVDANEEDDGAIPLARDTGIEAERPGIRTSGYIGDGPHGSAGSGTGDFDFYAVTAGAGTTLTVDITTPDSTLR